jgi:hypothetical protein
MSRERGAAMRLPRESGVAQVNAAIGCIPEPPVVAVLLRHRVEDDMKSPELILKELAIEKWSKGGLERPVKVVALHRGPLTAVGGYITQEKNIKGQPLREIESRLGLPVGALAAGAHVMALNRVPRAHEFELRSYTNLPGGRPYQPGGQYPPGSGVPQWELTVDIPSTPLKTVRPGQCY